MTQNDAVALLKQIISIPSFSGEEDRVAKLMEDTLSSVGYIVDRKGNNVWTRSKHFDPLKPVILLDAHIDTVKPTGEWKSDPFIPMEEKGKLIGLGSNDTGGSIVSMLAAFMQLDQKDQTYNMIYLASAEEENTGEGGIQSIISELGRVDLALIGEPTGMQPAVAERGLLVLDCLTRGVAGHAARDEGLNAIYKALSDIEWFRAYHFEKISDILGSVKMSVTGIDAGSLHNVVPAECRFVVDVRVNECYTNMEILDTIYQNVQCEVRPRSICLNSSTISSEHPVVKRCIELGGRPYGSPTTSNQAVIPFTSLKIGPGDSARSHTANEYIYIDEICEAIELYIQILDGLIL